jgi:hypothetical protein
VLGDDGIVTLDVYENTTYSFRALRTGYYPESRSVYVDSAQTVLNFEQERGSRFGAGFYMHNVTYPGVEGSVYILPSLLFIRLNLTTFAVGMPRDKGEGIPNGFPMTDLILSAGIYFNQADAVIRPYSGLSFQLRFNHIPKTYFGLDLLAPAGVSLVLGTELSTWLRVRPFLEFRPTLFFTESPLLVEAAYSRSTGEAAPYNFGSRSFLDLGNFLIGVRVQI